MCIIIAKPAGVKKPSHATIEECWNRNSDGAGLVYQDVEGKISIQKGFMKLKDFMAAWEGMNDSISLIAHFRIGTHGGKTKSNTHPFWIKERELALAHNGVLSMGSLVKNDGRSDTATFVDEVLKKLPDGWERSEYFLHMIAGYIGYGNKFAMMNAAGDIILINRQAGTEEGGVWYSNAGFRPYVAPIYPPYNGGFSRDPDEIWDSETRAWKPRGTGKRTPVGSTTAAKSAVSTPSDEGKKETAVTKSEGKSPVYDEIAETMASFGTEEKEILVANMMVLNDLKFPGDVGAARCRRDVMSSRLSRMKDTGHLTPTDYTSIWKAINDRTLTFPMVAFMLDHMGMNNIPGSKVVGVVDALFLTLAELQRAVRQQDADDAAKAETQVIELPTDKEVQELGEKMEAALRKPEDTVTPQQKAVCDALNATIKAEVGA